jgi:hypothetical protein
MLIPPYRYDDKKTWISLDEWIVGTCGRSPCYQSVILRSENTMSETTYKIFIAPSRKISSSDKTVLQPAATYTTIFPSVYPE